MMRKTKCSVMFLLFLIGCTTASPDYHGQKLSSPSKRLRQVGIVMEPQDVKCALYHGLALEGQLEAKKEREPYPGFIKELLGEANAMSSLRPLSWNDEGYIGLFGLHEELFQTGRICADLVPEHELPFDSSSDLRKSHRIISDPSINTRCAVRLALQTRPLSQQSTQDNNQKLGQPPCSFGQAPPIVFELTQSE